ncbi:MAG: hypothetical protein FWH29_01645 [Methanobrevibacter sp.]|nr:hypothetical protein [Methanobrevibacter sp.]
MSLEEKLIILGRAGMNHIDESGKCYIGVVDYKNQYISNISKKKKKNIFKRIIELSKEMDIRIKIE